MNPSETSAQRSRLSERNPLYRVGIVFLVGTACVLLLDPDFAHSGIRLMPQVMVAGLAMGGTALMLSLHRLCLVCFALSGLLAFKLQQPSTVPESFDRRLLSDVGSFNVEQYSTGNLFDGSPVDLSTLADSPADVVSIQGLSPDWASALSSALIKQFPHQYLFPDIGVHGIGLFAKTPFGSVDSTLMNGIVQVSACVPGPSLAGDVELIAVQTTPPVSNETYLDLQAQLEVISERIRRSTSAVVLMGDFNAVPWSPELSRFMYRAGVRDSRRCQLPSYEQGAPGLFEAPVEHILYNDQLNCVRFETLRTREHYLGNRASFQPAITRVVAL